MSETASAQKRAGDTQQPASTNPGPQAEHGWLQKLVGEWAYESDLGPEHQGAKATGTERGRSIGDFWVQLEATGQMPGPPSGNGLSSVNPSSDECFGQRVTNAALRMLIRCGK